MIEIHLDTYLKKWQMTLTQLSESLDISIANLSILKSDKAKAIRFSTLEKLCQALDC